MPRERNVPGHYTCLKRLKVRSDLQKTPGLGLVVKEETITFSIVMAHDLGLADPFCHDVRASKEGNIKMALFLHNETQA